MRFLRSTEKILPLLLALLLLLSGCKIAKVPSTPEDTKRTRQTTESTERTTRKSKTEATTEPSVDIDTETEHVDTEVVQTAPTAMTEAPDEPVEIPTEAPPDTEGPAIREEPVEPLVNLDGLYLPALEDRFFISSMAGESMDAFLEIYRAVMSFEPEVRFSSPITVERMSNLMMLLNYACPEAMNIDCEYTYYTNSDNLCTSVTFNYLLDVKTYEWACNEFRWIFEEVRRLTDGMDTFEKEKFVYELLIDSCTYDEYSTHSGTCYGSMLEGVARCEGYSKAFMWLMWVLDIPCMTVTGDILENGERHSWNIVEIDGSYAHVDTTFDDVEDGSEQYPYPYGFFNVSDAFISQNRQIDRLYYQLNLPACDDEYMNFHVQNGSFAFDEYNVVDVFVEQLFYRIECGEERIYLQCFDQYAYDELLSVIDAVLPEVLSAALNSWSYQWYSYPSSRCVIVDLSY